MRFIFTKMIQKGGSGSLMFFYFKLEDWQVKEMQSAIDKADTKPIDNKGAIFLSAYRWPENGDIYLKGIFIEKPECEKIGMITAEYLERIKNDGD